MRQRAAKTPVGIRGLSLIEVMVALAISAILLFGLSQIFIGSKNVYKLQEGMSRAQENARFVMQYLENNVRMAGYMGCGNDVDLTAKAGSPPAFLNHLRPMESGLGVVPIRQDTLTSAERFQRPIEVFRYTGGSTDNQAPTVGGPGDWTPALDAPDPVGFDGDFPIQGSDVLVLRLVSADSTAMVGDFDMANGAFTVVDPSQVKVGGVYTLTNCSNARVFRVTTVDNASGLVTAGPADNPLRLTSNNGSTWTGSYANMQFNQNGSTLNAELHSAQYLVMYVGLRPADNVPVLRVMTGPTMDSLVAQDVADGVEMMRIELGVDTDADGNIDKWVAPDNDELDSDLGATNKTQRDAAWRKVLSVRVALLMRSPDAAIQAAHTGDAPNDNVYYLFDTRVQRPLDYRFRDVYTTTISLRNRLGNY
jgi:type IV pilus assembly protein PilW